MCCKVDNDLYRITLTINFIKSTIFRSKIEKKAKEEYKKEVDSWLEYVSTKSINYEIYIPKKKISLKEEEILLHGIEKSINFNNYVGYKRYYYIFKSYLNELYNSYKRDFFYILLWLSTIASIYVVINKLNKIEKLLSLENNTCLK